MYKYLSLFFVLLFSNLQAQEVIKLSFDEAIEMALQQNANLQINRNQKQINQALHTEAKLRHLPNVSINSSAQRQLGQQFQLVEGELQVTNIATDFLTAGLSAQMDLFTGLRRTNNYQATAKRLEAQEHSIRQAELNLIMEIAQQYLQVLLDQELLTVARQNLKNQQQILKQINGFVLAGTRNKADQLSQEAEVSRAEMQVVEAEIQLDNDLQNLAFSLQLPVGYALQIGDQALFNPSVSYGALELNELFALALEQRPDYQQQQAVQLASRKELSISRAAYMPQLSAFFNYNSYYTSLDNRNFGTQFRDIYPTTTLGLRMSIPLFQGYTNRSNEVRANVALQNEELNNKALKQQIYREVQSAQLNYRSAMKREEASQKQYQAAMKNDQMQQERFQLGLGSVVDMANANNLKVQASSDLLQAQFNKQFNALILGYTIGDFAPIQ